MLPAAARLHTPAQFSAVTRGGRRAAGPLLVVHLLRSESARSRAGFVVSKKVGNSVVRHRVTRRLREVMRSLLPVLPVGTDIVVRALPEAADADSQALAAAVDSAVTRIGRKEGWAS